MLSREIQRISISTSTILRFFAVILGLALVFVIRDILFALIFAVIIASAVEPSIEWLKKRGFGRILAVVMIYIVFLVLAAFLMYLVLPLILDELHIAASTLTKIQRQIILGIQQTAGTSVGSFVAQNADVLLKMPLQYIGAFGQAISTGGTQVFRGIVAALLIFVFSFYLSTQEKGIESFLRMVTPLKYEPYALDLWRRSQGKLGRWLRAQMLLGAIVGMLIFIGLTMLGIQQALLLAVIAAVFEIIPVAGPILAAIPAIIIGFLVSPILGVSTIALYIVVQQTESHIIVPVVMKKAVGLSPLVVLVALLIGAEIGGIFGLLLAVPVT
ncbi:MAG: AI-2E family transporter, partial [Candidatus Sungbacteria bacterium]|nr:AI-2E family transporter [Candidatus Sungbacteria bacterium]